MILTNQLVVELYEGFLGLRAPGLLALPISVGYTIIKDIKTLESTYLAIISMRDSIAMKYGVNQGDGTFKVSEEDIPNAQAALDELWAIENSINLDLIPLTALAACSLPLDDLYKIYPIINGEA